MKNTSKGRQNSADMVALSAVAWLVGNEELLPVFLGASGATADDLRRQVSEPEFLGSVLDFILMDDAWVTAFCDAKGFAYTDPMVARRALPGGGETNWT